MPARARCSALFTELTESPRSPATSFAGQPSTSRRISTARGRGARCWTEAAPRITLAWAPGSRPAYSNVGYELLGLLVERCTGEAFADYASREVLARNELHGVTLPVPRRRRRRRSPGTNWSPTGSRPSRGPWSRTARRAA